MKQFDAAYVKELHRVLSERHIAAKLVCCDEYSGEGLGQWSIVDAIRNDPSLKAAVDVVGVHYSVVDGKYTTPDSARTLNKPIWSSEDQPNSGGGPILSREWQIGGRMLAKLYNRNYLEGGFTKTEIWSPVTAYYDILAAPNSGLMYANTPWSGHYIVHGKDWSVVLETIDAQQPQQITFKIKGGLAQETIHVWETNSQKTFEHVVDLAPQEGSFGYKFDPNSLYSLTTTTGQGRGAAHPPAQKSFPIPYAETFEDTPLERGPRFLSDQDGAFEVRSCLHRSGRCLEQIITEIPIPWGPLPDPFTLAGNVNWSDYRVACDIYLNRRGPVTLIGRIDSADVFRDGTARWPSGYVLTIDPDGKWTLSSAAYKAATRTLASGDVKLSDGQWHHAELKFRGSQITAFLDRQRLATVTDDSHSHGMFGIGTGWNRAQFDNLRVAKE